MPTTLHVIHEENKIRTTEIARVSTEELRVVEKKGKDVDDTIPNHLNISKDTSATYKNETARTLQISSIFKR